jgi:hypothetical protein
MSGKGILVCCVLGVLAMAPGAQATGLLGERYVGVGARVEMDVFSDNGAGVTAEANFPFHPNLDLGVLFEYVNTTGSFFFSFGEETDFLRGALFVTGHPNLEGRFEPFASAGVIGGSYTVTQDGEEEYSDDDAGPLVGVGVDIALFEQGTLRLSATYWNMFSDHFRLAVMYHHWLGETIGIRASVGVDFMPDLDEHIWDAEDSSANVGLGVCFRF